MITHAAANELRILINARCEAEREEAFAGAQRPEDADAIRLELENAKLELENYILKLTGRAT